MRDSFVMYTDWADQFEMLDDHQRSDLIMAIFSYQREEELPEMDATTAMAFSFIKKSLDKDTEKWEAAVRQRSEAGKRSAESRKRKAAELTSDDLNERDSTKSTSVKSVEKKSTKSTDNVHVYVPVSVNDKKNNLSIVSPKKTTLVDEFDELWSIYPRKQGKSKALQSYIKARKEGATQGEVRAGIESYKAYLAREKIENQFIKMGSTYFSQRSWTDEYSTSRVGEREDQRSEYRAIEF